MTDAVKAHVRFVCLIGKDADTISAGMARHRRGDAIIRYARVRHAACGAERAERSGGVAVTGVCGAWIC